MPKPPPLWGYVSKMALKMTSLMLACRKSLQSLHGSAQIRWQTTAHSLSVRQRIKEKRDQALIGGGLKRIKAQHKKVKPFLIYFNYFLFKKVIKPPTLLILIYSALAIVSCSRQLLP